jgi:hypothetical protein
MIRKLLKREHVHVCPEGGHLWICDHAAPLWEQVDTDCRWHEVVRCPEHAHTAPKEKAA